MLFLILNQIMFFTFRCQDGYYGDPRVGVRIPCRPCLCPGGPGSLTQHADTCSFDPRSQEVFCNCYPGYQGKLNLMSALTWVRSWFPFYKIYSSRFHEWSRLTYFDCSGGCLSTFFADHNATEYGLTRGLTNLLDYFFDRDMVLGEYRRQL